MRVSEGVFEPAEHAALVCVVVATTMIVVLVVPMGVLGILMPAHCPSSSLARLSGAALATRTVGSGTIVHWYSKTAATP
jgi:uncharacterized membrane protein